MRVLRSVSLGHLQVVGAVCGRRELAPRLQVVGYDFGGCANAAERRLLDSVGVQEPLDLDVLGVPAAVYKAVGAELVAGVGFEIDFEPVDVVDVVLKADGEARRVVAYMQIGVGAGRAVAAGELVLALRVAPAAPSTTYGRADCLGSSSHPEG